MAYRNAFNAIVVDPAKATNPIIGTSASETLTGTAKNDAIRDNGGIDTMIGGAGDDTYYVGNRKTVIVEQAGQGIDTVYASSDYTLSANVENLYLGSNTARYGGGNALDNVLTSAFDNQTLDGGAGNDVLVGLAKNTTFVFAKDSGSDAIYGFDGTDKIRLDHFGLTKFSQVQSILSQDGANAVLNFANGQKLVLNNTQASSLAAGNFLLDADTSGRTLTFADEFDSLSLYSNATKTGTWRTEYGYGGSGTNGARTLNNELEIYMDANYGGTSGKPLGINPFSLDKGVLTITAAPTPTDALKYLSNLSYTSGLLTSKFSFAQEYGYFEVRAKMPDAQGFWPAFWMLPTDNSWPPELDVFEVLSGDPSTVYVTSHGIDPTTGAKNGSQNVVHIDTTQFHTYGVDWGPNVLKYYIDGVQVAEQTTPEAMKNKEMFMLLNLAVGGSWGGNPVAGASAQMQVDYIRAYATADTVSTTIKGVHTEYATKTGNVPQSSATLPAAAAPAPAPAPTYAAPIAKDDAYAATKSDTLVVSAAQGVLANDTRDASLGATASLVKGPAHGTLTLNADGSFTYVPTTGYTGADSFTYLEKDSSGASSAAATVSLTVAPGVIAHTDSGFTTAYATATKINASALLANDSSQLGKALSIASVGEAQHGTVALVNGQVVFTPDAYYNGAASFTYTAVDTAGHTDTATVALTVAAEAKPASLYLAGSAGSDLIDKSSSSFGWMIAGGDGNDKLYGGNGANSLNGGAGNDIIIGGADRDFITGGKGIDVMTGGAGNDTFAIAAGDLVNKGAAGVDTITDFHAFGTGTERDMIRFTGFSSKATLTMTSSNADGSFLYHVTDGANSGDILIQSSGQKLSAADFAFV